MAAATSTAVAAQRPFMRGHASSRLSSVGVEVLADERRALLLWRGRSDGTRGRDRCGDGAGAVPAERSA